MSPGKHFLRRRMAIALLAFAGLVLAAAALQPWWLGPLVAHLLSASSGRAVRFDTLWIGVSAGLEPVVHFAGVRIENAPWADARWPFAAVGAATAVVSWRSLAERRPVIAMLVLHDARIDLERQADGLRNWRLEHPEDRGPGRYKLLALEAHRSTIRFVHRGIDLELEAAASPNASTAGPTLDEPLPTRVDLEGAWRLVGFAASVATSEVLTFLETGRTFRLRGQLEAGNARLDVDGRAGDVVREPMIDAKVVLGGTTLAPFRAFVGPHYGDAKAFHVEGRLKAGDHRYALSSAQARIGATDLAGDVESAHDESRNAFRANLRSESSDLADLRWLAGRGSAPQHSAHDTVPASSAPFDFTAARGTDADVNFAARRLHAADFPALQSLKVKAVLAQGQLTVSALDLGVGEGHATGHVALDLREKAANIEAELALHGVRVEALLRDQPHEKRVTGALQAQARLTASGTSPAALLASASGTVSASLGGGTISSLLDAEMGLQGGKILRSMIGGAEPIAIRCATAAIDLRRGRGRVRTLVIDTERTRTTGKGTLDLPEETLDLVLTPQAKHGGLFVLDRSIRLHGPLRKLEHSLVDRAAAPPGAGCAE